MRRMSDCTREGTPDWRGILVTLPTQQPRVHRLLSGLLWRCNSMSTNSCQDASLHSLPCANLHGLSDTTRVCMVSTLGSVCMLSVYSLMLCFFRLYCGQTKHKHTRFHVQRRQFDSLDPSFAILAAPPSLHHLPSLKGLWLCSLCRVCEIDLL